MKKQNSKKVTKMKNKIETIKNGEQEYKNKKEENNNNKKVIIMKIKEAKGIKKGIF